MIFLPFGFFVMAFFAFGIGLPFAVGFTASYFFITLPIFDGLFMDLPFRYLRFLGRFLPAS